MSVAAMLVPAVLAAQEPLDFARASRGMEAVAARVAPAVVEIRVTAWGPAAAGSTLISLQRSAGSGVLLSADGYLVTNAHVVEGGRRFAVRLLRPAASGVPDRSALRAAPLEVPAHLIGIDTETDLAVLKIDLGGLPYATLADSDSLAPGRLVLAFGSPMGYGNSVTMGVVSAVGRQLREDDRMLYIQTDAPINPGNSGGPLVDGNGAVVGINTLIASQSGGSEGIGFAAPSNIVRHVVDELRVFRRVRRGVIGAFAQTITPALAQALSLDREWGVILGDVYPGSPAERAGLRIGDVIYAVDGKQVENGRQFDVTVYRKPIGRTVMLDVGRGASRLRIAVAVLERRDDGSQFGDLVTPEQNLVPRLGILGIDLTPDLARAIPGLRLPQGVIVAAIAGDAASAGSLMPGDVIHTMNGAGLSSLAQLRTAIQSAAPGSSVVFQVSRQGQVRYVTLSVD